ncbi:hypothetical protein ABZ858_21640 [Streptomyces sp. NPDC047017]|uniref:hypothetical protein n=1 Tax=Streptomyces sp. NPDC047017 TaxID=3155024 RepID=UPI0033CCD5F1
MGVRRERHVAAVARRRTITEEITAFGEMLAAHSFTPGGADGTPENVRDWERALDAYERAGRLSERRRPDLGTALVVLEEGRAALARLDDRRTRARAQAEDSSRSRAQGGRRDARPWRRKRPAPVVEHGRRAAAADPGTGSPRPAAPAADSKPRLQPRPVPGVKPHWRDRITRAQLLKRLAWAAAGCYAVAVSITVNPMAALFSLMLGGMAGGLTCIAGMVAWAALSTVWAVLCRGGRVRAEFTSRRTVGKTYQDVFTVKAGPTTVEHVRTIGGPQVAPMPHRTVWFVPASRSGRDAATYRLFTPLWLAILVLTGGPATLALAAVTLYLVPGAELIQVFG